MNNKPVVHSFEFDPVKFRHAASTNNVDATQKWVPFASVAMRVQAMGDAAYYGQLECVKVLAEYVDPREKNSWGLFAACVGHLTHGNTACFDFLWPLSCADEVLEGWAEVYGESENVLVSQKIASAQKQRIEEQLPPVCTPTGQKKI